MSWSDGYSVGYSKGFADCAAIHRERLGEHAKKSIEAVNTAPGSFVPCDRWDWKGSYCIEGIDCSCMHSNRRPPS